MTTANTFFTDRLFKKSTLGAALSLACVTLSCVTMGSLAGCSPSGTEATNVASRATIAPGAPGASPTWAFAGKTGIGTSYEPYVDGSYLDSETNPVSRVWFSIAQGILTETMYGLIHNAQLKELQFVVTGKDFVDTEKDDTVSETSYLHTDEQGRPLSLAYKIVNKDKQGKYQIEKHIFTDPDRDSLMMKVIFTAFEDGLTAHLYANPHIDNAGGNDVASVEGDALIAHTLAPDSSFMSIKADRPFTHASAGFVGVSDGLTDLRDNGKLDWQYLSTSESTDAAAGQGSATVGNVALTASFEALSTTEPLELTLAIGFGKDKAASLANADASLNAGYHALLAAYKGDANHQGWQDYLASLPQLAKMSASTRDSGKLLYASAMVLKAQEDKTHGGALIASLSNPWGDSVSATVASTGYKAVWPRDFYQCAMAFLAMGDIQTPKVAFEYLKKVQVTSKTPGFSGTPGWFLQKTHVDGQIEWVAVQLDQTAMPIMLGWKLWQAGVLTDTEIRHWYHEMLKGAADFLISGGDISLDWNQTHISPPKTQQERWEEQAGYSPSTTAAVVAGLIAASDIARAADDKTGSATYLNAARSLAAKIETLMVSRNGLLGTNDTADTGASEKTPPTPYYLRLSPNGMPDTDALLADNNGRAGLDQRQILDGGFLELVRYGVKSAVDPVINNTAALVDSTSLEDNLRLRYDFTAKDGTVFPGYRRYGNDGYGEDTQTGHNYAESGSNSANQRGRVWPFFTGERGHFELAQAKASGTLTEEKRAQLLQTYVQGMETFANEGLMLPEQVWDGVGDSTRYQYSAGQGTNAATPLAWTHAEYVKLVRSMADGQVWDFYPIVPEALNDK